METVLAKSLLIVINCGTADERKEAPLARQNKWNTPEKRARIGERIKVAATQAGLSLKELAEAAGSKTPVIYQYVRGIISITPVDLNRIADFTRFREEIFDPKTDARSTLELPE